MGNFRICICISGLWPIPEVGPKAEGSDSGSCTSISISRSVRIMCTFMFKRGMLVYWHVMGDDSDVMGYGRRTLEQSGATLHMKKDTTIT